MEIRPLLLLYTILSSSSGCFSTAKIWPTFPSSIIQADKYDYLTESTTTKTEKLYKTKYFTQILDHFNYNPQSYETFQQRYLINDKFWGGAENNAPIFVYMGNEGDIEWFAENTGFMFDNAPHFKALLVFIEHRYYGKSIPFGGDEVANSNSSTLGYLSSAQALADYATLIVDLKNNLTATDSPVLVFGGSYGGMLAAWFRLKYPHVAIGALASSAPVLFFENLTSSYSFANTITQDFRGESENCYETIKGSWKQIEEAAKGSKGRKMLQKHFRLCQDEISADKLESWVETAFVYTAMTDYPTPSNFLNPLPAYPVKQMCKAIDDPKREVLWERLYGAVNIYYNYSGSVKRCFDLDHHSDTQGLDGWTWQACTEMIMPTDGSNQESIFPVSEWNYSERVQLCKDAFDIQPRADWITTEFGGHNIERVLKRFGSNIIFFNGLRDPWSGGGVLRDISESIIAIVAREGAHHVDLRFSSKEDPEWLRDVRRREIDTINLWISQYYRSLGEA